MIGGPNPTYQDLVMNQTYQPNLDYSQMRADNKPIEEKIQNLINSMPDNKEIKFIDELREQVMNLNEKLQTEYVWKAKMLRSHN